MMATTNDDDNNLTTIFLPQDVENDTLPPEPRRSKLSLLTLAIGTLGCCTALTALAYTRHDTSKTIVPQTLSDEPTWAQISKLDGAMKSGNFGFDVALSDKAAVLVVGEPFAEKETSDSGTLRFFRLNATENVYKEIAEPRNGFAPGDNFGWSVAVTADGEWAVASAPNSTDKAGEVHMFEIVEGKEDEEDKVHRRGFAAGKETSDYFGYSVAMSDTAVSEDLHQIRTTRVCVGAPALGSSDRRGYVRVLEVDMAAKAWKQVGKDIEGDDEKEFGTSVGISSGGDVVVVGTPLQNKAGVFMFLVGQWVQKGPDIVTGESDPNAKCGSSVDVSADGNKVVIGCKNSDTVHTYYWKSDSWSPIGNGIKGDVGIGRSVSMSADGAQLAFGEPNYGGKGNGKVLVYDWSHDNHDWALVHQEQGNPGDRAGYSVCISPDGKYFAVGAPTSSDQAGFDTLDNTPKEHGEVRVFGNPN